MYEPGLHCVIDPVPVASAMAQDSHVYTALLSLRSGYTYCTVLAASSADSALVVLMSQETHLLSGTAV